jgi:hypothetical protein
MIGAVAGTAPFVTAAALFAALGVASGRVIGARHRPKDSATPLRFGSNTAMAFSAALATYNRLA